MRYIKIPYLFILLLSLLIISCGSENSPTYEISTNISPNDGGEISISPEGTVHDEGTEITLTPKPSQGYGFSEWNGDYSSTDNPLTFTLNKNTSVTGIFVEKSFYRASNGITVMCPNTTVGEKGVIDGVEYESVDRDLLMQRRDEGADLTTVCTSLVSDMSNMFKDAEFNQDISAWDVSNVTRMFRMFQGSTFNQDISSWDVSKVTSMAFMFYKTPFDQDVSNWEVGNVTNMAAMFYGIITFNQDISGWDVSKVTDMAYMFRGTQFNQDVGNWDVSNVTKMEGMFSDSDFNQPIDNWCVEQIPSEPNNFSTDSPLTEENKPVWGTCPSN